MRKLISAISVILVCLSSFAQQKDTLRVLAIGNSFSQDAVNQYLHEIAGADGRVFIIGNLYIGGCTLERHYQNVLDGRRDYIYYKIDASGKFAANKEADIYRGVFDEKWDVVTLQQASGYSGLIKSYEPYLGELVRYIRKNVPGAKIMWHQTWAYAKDAVHGHYMHYDSDQMKMYDAIVKCSSSACEKYGLGVIPSGTAVQNARFSPILQNVTRDGFHLHYLVGRYIAACTWYEALSGRTVVGNSYVPEGVRSYQAEIARNAAHYAVQEPFAVTKMWKFDTKEYRDESLVPEYTLPDPLVMADGTPVRTRRQWMESRRPELLKLFAEEEYGTLPSGPAEGMHFKVLRTTDSLYGGRVKAKEIIVYFAEDEKKYMKLVEFLPAEAQGPVPVFLGMNFKGNYTLSDEDWVSMPTKKELSSYSVFDFCERGTRATENGKTGRWDVEKLVSNGYGLVSYYYCDVTPDFDGALDRGVHRYFENGGYTWKAIGAWAWSLSRALDYLETDPDVDASKVAVFGHSRLGKAALWAGALDERFAMVIANESGCGGDALFKRHYGETAQIINYHFPYWFCDNFWKYNENEAAMPFDQHELLALIAPRPLYVASAEDDQHSDPKGQRLASEEAAKVYARFWGKKAAAKVGYHHRQGKHDVTPEDWDHYIDFANKYLK